MKKIAFLMLIISVIFTVISCGGNSSDDTETGYVDPGDWTGKDVKTSKKYYLTNGALLNEECGLIVGEQDGRCNAIIYQNRLNNINYVGIAVNNAHTATPPSFNLKIYWQADTINSVPAEQPQTLNSCTAIVGNEREEGLTISDVTITDVTPGGSTVTVYTINFGTPFNVGATTNISGSITAVKYP